MRAIVVAMLVLLAGSLYPRAVGANDSFAEVAAGGIKFLKQSDIVLQKEVLTIRVDRVEVVYRFSNPTKAEIAITVAFPMPAYSFRPDSSSSSPNYDFSVATDGEPQELRTIIEARLNGKNVTAELERAGLPLADFGPWDGPQAENPSVRLSKRARKQLVAHGLLDEGEGSPLWAASVTHVWEQRFPAGRTIEIRHTYTPQTGKSLFGPEAGDRGWSAADLPAGCSPSKEALAMAVRPENEGGMIFQTLVAYILTTANNWKTPIGEFTLVVPKERDETVVLCSDLPTPTVSADSVEVSLKDYVPSRDLAVYFLAVHGPKAASQDVR